MVEKTPIQNEEALEPQSPEVDSQNDKKSLTVDQRANLIRKGRKRLILNKKKKLLSDEMNLKEKTEALGSEPIPEENTSKGNDQF